MVSLYNIFDYVMQNFGDIFHFILFLVFIWMNPLTMWL